LALLSSRWTPGSKRKWGGCGRVRRFCVRERCILW
jgi:hypothetical protein